VAANAARAPFLDRLGRYEPAATIAGYAANPMTEATTPETGTAVDHLREILGDQTYESLARNGATMTTAGGGLRLRPIDQARTALNAVAKLTTYESLKVRVVDGTAILRTSLTSSDTILAWTTLAVR
jgi:hypothetical protein